MTVYTSNIQKGGALLDDARRLVEVWDQHEDTESNLERIAGENLLAKPSRARAEDVLRRILRPRLVEPGPQIIAALKILLPSQLTGQRQTKRDLDVAVAGAHNVVII